MSNLRQIAAADARRYGLDPSIFVRQISAESGFNPRARSGAGARGVAQIMPGTAAGWGVNPDDPIAALDAAARHMAQYVKHYGSYRNALAAYNAGPGAVGGPLPAETRAYISKILGGSGNGPRSTGGGTAPSAERSRTYLPGSTTVDKSDAAVAALLAHAQSPGTSLLKTFVNNLNSGLYTHKVAPSYKLGPMVPGVTEPPQPTAPGKQPKGTANFEGTTVAAWIKPWLVRARQAGWKGKVSSGFRSFADQTRIYNSGVRPAAKPGTSNHEGTDYPRGAVDVTNAPQLAAILRKLGAPLQWAGAKDPVHFSHPHGGSY